jgi:hypothetical protein
LKQRITEQSAERVLGNSSAIAGDAAHYGAHAKQLRAQAEEFDRKSEEANAESEHALSPHTKLAISMTFLQIAIALASITALTRKRWLLVGAVLSALVGVGLGVLAWL